MDYKNEKQMIEFNKTKKRRKEYNESSPMIRADSEFSLDLTLAENVRANSPIENTLPQIKSMDLIKSAEKSGARG